MEWHDTSFRTTRWSVVHRAGAENHADARAALDELCGAYWAPLYAWLRRTGNDEQRAMDLVQGFLARLLEQGAMRGVDRERGSFRAYLLGALRHYVQNDVRHDNADKRGGGAPMLSLDARDAEGRYLAEAVAEETPEEAFDRHFAIALLERVIQRLGDEYAARGRAEAFDELKRYLTTAPEAGDYARAAAALECEVTAVKVSVHRMRRRLHELVMGEIVDTVDHPDDEAHDELGALLRALGGAEESD